MNDDSAPAIAVVSSDADKVHAAAAELAPEIVAKTDNNHQAASGMVVQLRRRANAGEFMASEQEMHAAAMAACNKLRGYAPAAEPPAS